MRILLRLVNLVTRPSSDGLLAFLIVLFTANSFACEERDVPSSEGRGRLARAEKQEGIRALALAPAEGGGAVESRIESLRSKLLRNSANLEGWILLGREWIKKARRDADPGFYAHANAAAEIALELEPENRLGLDLKGLVLMNEHRFSEARDLARSILARDPDDLVALGVLGDAELELGDFDAALRAVQEMVDLKPCLPSYGRAAYLRWLMGDLDAAKHFARLAIDSGLSARDSEPVAWMAVEAARMFFLGGDYEGADAGFDRALDLFAGHPGALLGKARVALARGSHRSAAAFAKKSYEASPGAEAAWVLFDAERLAGNADGQRDALDALMMIGRHGDRRTLALFLATENRDIPVAVKMLEDELAGRGDIYTLDAYAFALYRAGRISEAKEASDRALRLGTKDPSLLYHAGAIRIAAGEVRVGLSLLRSALGMSPNFHPVGAADARRLLRERGSGPRSGSRSGSAKRAA